MMTTVDEKDNALFTEMSEDESSQVSGGCYRRYRHYGYRSYGYGYYGYRPSSYYYAPSSYYSYGGGYGGYGCRRSYYY